MLDGIERIFNKHEMTLEEIKKQIQGTISIFIKIKDIKNVEFVKPETKFAWGPAMKLKGEPYVHVEMADGNTVVICADHLFEGELGMTKAGQFLGFKNPLGGLAGKVFPQIFEWMSDLEHKTKVAMANIA